MKWLFCVLLATCIYASNGKGTPRSLTVTPKLQDGDNLSIEAGTRQTFTCKAGNNKQKLKWLDLYGNTVPVAEGERVFAQEHIDEGLPALELVLTSVKPDDTGAWRCKSGRLTEEVNLCVIVRATFSGTEEQVTADAGGSATLKCVAHGETEPQLQWSRNGQVITDWSQPSKYMVMNTKYSDRFEAMIRVKSLTPQDEGVYTCEALQKQYFGSITCESTGKMNITLQVNHAPIFVENTSLIYARYNESINLTCSADGTPPPTYRWFSEDGDILTELYDHHPYESLQEGGSVLSLVAEKKTMQRRIVECRASNTFGEDVKAFVLIPLVEPEVPEKIHLQNSTDTEICLYILWDKDIEFTVDVISVQYINIDDFVPGETEEWSLANTLKIFRNETQFEDDGHGSYGFILHLEGLQKATEYLVRVRLYNSAYASDWSEAVNLATKGIKESSNDYNILGWIFIVYFHELSIIFLFIISLSSLYFFTRAHGKGMRILMMSGVLGSMFILLWILYC